MSTTNTIDNNDRIILGSGVLYVVEYSGEIPEDSAIETDANRAGNIKSGATLEYSSTSQTVKDDLGRVKKTVITDENVKFKTGMITWAPLWIQALVSTARVDTKTKTGHCIFKLGGLGNRQNKNYLYRFVHTYESGCKLRITVTGKNVGTVAMAFNPENPATADAEISSEALDGDGTLVIIDDEFTESEG